MNIPHHRKGRPSVGNATTRQHVSFMLERIAVGAKYLQFRRKMHVRTLRCSLVAALGVGMRCLCVYVRAGVWSCTSAKLCYSCYFTFLVMSNFMDTVWLCYSNTSQYSMQCFALWYQIRFISTHFMWIRTAVKSITVLFRNHFRPYTSNVSNSLGFGEIRPLVGGCRLHPFR